MALNEDLAHAVFTIISASNAQTGKLRRGYVSHFQPWYRARVLSEFRPNSADPLIQSMRQRKPVNSFALEFFSQGILRRLGIRTVEQTICSGREARALPHNYVVKVAGNSNNLRWNPNPDPENGRNISWNADAVRSGWCLVSRLEPESASLDFVWRTLITSQSVRTQRLRESAAIHAQTDQTLDELIAQALGKTCVPADKFFANFQPSESEIELIKRAMALDGSPYLLICAARIFIGCSAPHFGNVLVTKKGELVSIDNFRGYFEKNDDIRELFYFVDRKAEAFKALDDVARLTESDIRESVDGIPRHDAVGSTVGLVDYFCTRLKLWKRYAEKEISRSPEMEIDPHLTVGSVGLFGRRLIEGYTPLWRA
jgi:hypothetical protein